MTALARVAIVRTMKLPAFEYACPTTLSEAVALLASHNGEAKALAGGQSLVPMMAFRVAQPSLLVDLRRLPGLKEIKIGADGVRIGALVRWQQSVATFHFSKNKSEKLARRAYFIFSRNSNIPIGRATGTSRPIPSRSPSHSSVRTEPRI